MNAKTMSSFCREESAAAPRRNGGEGMSAQASLEKIQSALSYISPEDRDLWVRVGMAIKAELGDAGRWLWDDWSQSAENYNERAASASWRSFKSGGKVQIGTVFYLAKEKGWTWDKPERKLTAQELEAIRAASRKRAEEEAAKKLAEQEQAAVRAASIWGAATDAASHPYLTRKGIAAHGLKIGKWEVIDSETGEVRVVSPMALLVPIRDRTGKLWSLQAIFPRKTGGRDKDYLKNGAKAGHFHAIGKPVKADGKLVFVLAEGYATGASVHAATGHCVLACFDAGNLLPVAAAIRERQPDAIILLAADDDRFSVTKDGNKYNPGVDAATKAAQEVGGFLAVPQFASLEGCPTDFNDLACREGASVVAAQIAAALAGAPVQTAAAPADELAGAVDALEAVASVAQTQVTDGNTIPFRPPSLVAADVRDGTECTRPLSETGNALRLLDMYGERLRFAPEAKAWLVWRDGAWQWDVDGAAVRATAADLPNRIYNEGAIFDFMEAEHFAKWARKSQTAKVVDAAVRLLSDRGEVRLPLAVVDSDPMLAGLNNAREIIDLTTGKVRPAEPSDLVTKSLRVSGIGKTANAARWLQFLDQVFGGDEALIDWLHRWCGYLLSGSTREQIMLFCFGHGANGKSIFAETLRHVLGDYGRSVPVETLCESKRQAGGATPDLADLISCRLAMSSETEDGQALAESLVKSLVGGDTISARPLYGRPVQFAPAFKLLMLGNHRPVIRGTDHGIWRRIRLVPFSRTFGPDERDPTLLDKLKAEAPHILAWMLEGCLKWQRRGLGDVPSVVAAQTKDYREEQDLVGQWLAERVDSGSAAAGCTCPGKLLYGDYCEWAEANGLRPCSAIALGRRLRERGLVSERKSSGSEFQGIALKPKN